MRTKYILHGGAAQDDNPGNDAFFAEILKDAPLNPKVLLVYFAKETDRIPTNMAEDLVHFDKNKGDKNPAFEVAIEEEFLGQVQRSDVLYLHGGRSSKLLASLKKFPNLKAAFEGKIVAGESAGANVLGAYFYSLRTKAVSEGLGILPLKIIPHYTPELEGKLDGYGPGLELLLLPEYTYRVFDIIS